MNIEKIKNYNQKILALLGSLAVLFGIIGLITLLVFLIDEIFPIHHKNRPGLLADEKVEKLKEDNLRQQIVSYYLPVLADTANLIYYIPVSHKTLQNPEYISDDFTASGSLDMYESKWSNDRYYHNETDNNLLIYYQKTNETIQVFNERIFIDAIRCFYFSDDIILICRGVTKDTDKNGVINLNDLNALFLYSVTNRKLNKVTLENMDITAYKFIPDKKILHIGFGYDRDGNGTYDKYTEPQIIKEYNISTNELNTIVSDELDNAIQKLIQGN